jgi:phytoene desaturase
MQDSSSDVRDQAPVNDSVVRGHLRPPHAQGGSKAVVIGSGFGGLAAAIRLSVRGYQVEVLEQRDAPGGRAYVYKQDGFVFDGGPTVITAPQLLEELWEICGEKLSDDVDLRPVSPFYRILFDDGTSFDYSGDKEAMRQEIQRISPRDVRGYERLLEMSGRIFEVGFERLAHVPFSKWTDMLKILPEMIKLKSYKTVYALVSDYIEDPRLRQVFSFHPLLVGGNPFATTSIYSLIPHLEQKWGVHFPIGGTGSLISGLVALLARRGVKVRCQAKVREIVVENGRAAGVLLDTGEKIAADVVVSNADSAFTLKHLVPAHARPRWTDARIDRANYSMSLFVWYFGTDRQYPEVAHHTLVLGPRYKELLHDIFNRKHLAEDFSLYLHRPTATDPNLAPPSCDGFYVLSPVPHLDGDTDWSKAAESYREKVAAVLEAKLLPGLRQHLVSSRLLTPIEFRDELSSLKGAAFGLAPVLTQSAYFRPHNESEDLPGLYFVGAGTHPGAGVPGVLSSAKVLDQVVPAPRMAPRGIENKGAPLASTQVEDRAIAP